MYCNLSFREFYNTFSFILELKPSKLFLKKLKNLNTQLTLILNEKLKQPNTHNYFNSQPSLLLN